MLNTSYCVLKLYVPRKSKSLFVINKHNLRDIFIYVYYLSMNDFFFCMGEECILRVDVFTHLAFKYL